MNRSIYSSDGVNPNDAERIGNLYQSGGQAGSVYDSNNCGPCLPGFGAGGGGKELKVAIPIECDMETSPGFNQNNVVHNVGGISRTLIGQGHCGNEPKVAIPINTMPDGSCRTLKYQYQKNNSLNFNSDGDRGATAVAIPVCIGGFGEKKSNNGTQFYQQDRIYSSDTVAPSLTNNLPGGSNRVAIPVLTPDRANKRQNGRRFKEDGDPSFTLTSQDRHGVAIGINNLYNNSVTDDMMPSVIGGIGEKNFGKQYRQGNRVYDSEKVATSLEASPVGNMGGNSNLYAIKVEPLNISGNVISESIDEAHTLNCTDQRKKFGSKQIRTVVGYKIIDN